MKLKPIIFYPFMIAALAGCAGVSEKNDLMARQIGELKASLNETNSRVEELNNKFMLLFEKVEASKKDIERLNSVPATPPEGLKVVAIGEEADHKKEAPAKARKEVKDAQIAPTVTQAVPAARAETPEGLYSRGQDLVLSGRFDEARKVFNTLVKSFPASDLADNALYWAGETYYSEKDFAKAADKFREVTEKYPEGNKAPDALLKEGYSYMELKEGPRAKELFERLVKRYPDSEAANKAKKTLDRLSDGKK